MHEVVTGYVLATYYGLRGYRVAQAMVEGITLLTADPLVAQYPGPVRSV